MARPHQQPARTRKDEELSLVLRLNLCTDERLAGLTVEQLRRDYRKVPHVVVAARLSAAIEARATRAVG